MKALSFAVLLPILFSGCDLKDNAQAIETCWSKDTKASMQRMIEESAGEYILQSVQKAGKEKLTEEQKTFVKSRTSISLESFHAINSFRDAGRLTCGVRVGFTFTRDNDRPMKGTTISEFDISKGENGLIYSFNKIPINLMLDSAKADD